MGYLIINSQQDYSLSKSKLCNCIMPGWRLSNKLTTSSRSIGISYLICMNTSEERLLSPMVHLMQLFSLLIVLIERSHSHDVTRRVAAILRRMYWLGKSSGSHAFKDAAHKISRNYPISHLHLPTLKFGKEEL